MPDRRTHRGPHPEDANLFALGAIENIKVALTDYSALRTKGYAEKSALKLVCDKFLLTDRQRLAVMRSACSDQQLLSRKQRQVKIESLAKKKIVIDGYNLLITIEAAVSGGVIFKGRDGCFRDLASIHGTYRKVLETIPAVELIGDFLQEFKIADCLWLFDSPVSNSGRLKTLMGMLAEKHEWNWQIKLLPGPDSEMIKTDPVIVTSDSVVLDRCKQWANLARAIIETKLPTAWLIDLS